MATNYRDGKVRVIFIPRMTTAAGSRDDLKKFIDETDLFKIKPDARFFGCGDDESWVSIPDDFEVPDYLIKRAFYGGLYAALMCYPDDTETGKLLKEWRNNNDDYEGNNGTYGIHRPACMEYFNVFNRHGLNGNYSEQNGFTYLEYLYPICEIVRPTTEQMDEMKSRLLLLEKSLESKKSIDIDLTEMVKEEENTSTFSEVHFEDNMLVLYKESTGHEGTLNMVTHNSFNCPLKIEMRTKTDKGSVFLLFGKYAIALKWSGNELLVAFERGEWKRHRNIGKIPQNEFVDIEWLIGKKVTAVKVNGELRYIGMHYKYITEFSDNPNYSLSGTVGVGTEKNATVTVESLRVTEVK